MKVSETEAHSTRQHLPVAECDEDKLQCWPIAALLPLTDRNQRLSAAHNL